MECVSGLARRLSAVDAQSARLSRRGSSGRRWQTCSICSSAVALRVSDRFPASGQPTGYIPGVECKLLCPRASVGGTAPSAGQPLSHTADRRTDDYDLARQPSGNRRSWSAPAQITTPWWPVPLPGARTVTLPRRCCRGLDNCRVSLVSLGLWAVSPTCSPPVRADDHRAVIAGFPRVGEGTAGGCTRDTDIRRDERGVQDLHEARLSRPGLFGAGGVGACPAFPGEVPAERDRSDDPQSGRD